MGRMSPLIRTARLRLRRLTASDLDHLHALDNDPAVMRYLNGGEPVSREAIARAILPAFMSYDDERPGQGVFAIEDGVTGDFLGWVSLRPTGAPDEAALGYRLRQAAWGHGIATEAAAALIDHGFARLGLRRVVATTYEDNHASIRVMEKLGLSLVRRFRYTLEELAAGDTTAGIAAELWPGEDVEYALTRAAWLARRDDS